MNELADQSEKPEKNLGFGWGKFYIFMGFITGSITLITAVALLAAIYVYIPFLRGFAGNSPAGAWWRLLLLGFIGLVTLAYSYGMLQRYRIALFLTWVILAERIIIGFTVIFKNALPFNQSNFLNGILIIIFGGCWFVYFYKRRHLFNKPLSANEEALHNTEIKRTDKHKRMLIFILFLGLFLAIDNVWLSIFRGPQEENPARQIRLNGPLAVAVDKTNDRVYVADSENNRVLWWNSSALLTNGQPADGVLGQPDFFSNGAACTAHGMHTPCGIGIDGAGNVWVADQDNNRVLKFNKPSAPTGEEADIVLGQKDFTSNMTGCSAINFNKPLGISLDRSGNVWIADTNNNRVLRFNAPTSVTGEDADMVLGQPNFTSLLPASTNTGLNKPRGVCVDGSDNVWVADQHNSRVLQFNPPAAAAGEEADIVLRVLWPMDVSVDGAGNVWVADSVDHRVLKFNRPVTSVVKTADIILGNSAPIDNKPTLGGCSKTAMSYPRGVSIDGSGNIWVADRFNNRVLKFNTPAAATGEDADLVLGHGSFTSTR